MFLKVRILPALVLATGAAAVLATAPALAQPAVLPAFAQPAASTPQRLGHPFARLRRCLVVLDLTDAQKADIKAVFDAAKPQFEALAATLKADRDALKTDLSKTPPDPCAIGNDVLKLHADREAMRTFLGGVKDQMLALLTDAQKAKLAGCLEAPWFTADASAETGDDE